MHDWTLGEITINWITGTLIFFLKNNKSEDVKIQVSGLYNLNLPKKEEWGRSVSINEINGPLVLANGHMYLEIEIQSGDTISLEAKLIELP